jgi:hypothetical protein
VGEIEELPNALIANQTVVLPVGTDEAAQERSEGKSGEATPEGGEAGAKGAADLAAHLLSQRGPFGFGVRRNLNRGNLTAVQYTPFAPLLLQGAESHPLAANFQPDAESGKGILGGEVLESSSSGEEEEEEEEENAAADEGEPPQPKPEFGQEEGSRVGGAASSPRAKSPAPGLRSRTAAGAAAETDSCLACRMDNEISRASCPHDGYLQLNLLSLSQWSLMQFYLCLLDKSGSALPISFTAPGAPPAQTNALQWQQHEPIDFATLTEQVATWVVRRRLAHAAAAAGQQHSSGKLNLKSEYQAELLRQKLILAETRFYYLLAHNDWRRMVSFLSSLPLAESRTRSGVVVAFSLSASGHFLPSQEIPAPEAGFDQLLLASLPGWMRKHLPSSSHFMREIVLTELARAGWVRASELPKLRITLPRPSYEEEMERKQVYPAAALDFLPLLRRLAKTGVLFRPMAREEELAESAANSEVLVPSFLDDTERKIWESKRRLRRDIVYRRALSSSASAASSPTEGKLSLDNTSSANMAHLLPFYELSPFHIFVLNFAERNGLVGLLAAYISHYRLVNFDALTAANKLSSSVTTTASTNAAPTAKQFKGWAGIELFLRQGEYYQAALMNCNTYLASNPNSAAAVMPTPARKAGAGAVASPPPAALGKSARLTPAAAATAASPLSSSVGTASVLASTPLPKAKDPTQTHFMQSLFSRGLHVMALATLMFYPPEEDVGIRPGVPQRRGEPAKAAVFWRPVAKVPSALAPPAPLRIPYRHRAAEAAAAAAAAAAGAEAQRGETHLAQRRRSSAASLGAASDSSVASASNRREIRKAQRRGSAAILGLQRRGSERGSFKAFASASAAAALPPYVLPPSGSAPTLFFRLIPNPLRFRPSAVAAAQRRVRKINFAATDTLPLRWFDWRTGRLTVSSMRALRLLTSTPSILVSEERLPTAPAVPALRALGTISPICASSPSRSTACRKRGEIELWRRKKSRQETHMRGEKRRSSSLHRSEREGAAAYRI